MQDENHHGPLTLALLDSLGPTEGILEVIECSPRLPCPNPRLALPVLVSTLLKEVFLWTNLARQESPRTEQPDSNVICTI